MKKLLSAKKGKLKRKFLKKFCSPRRAIYKESEGNEVMTREINKSQEILNQEG
jgi:hypothetical protein